MPASSPGPKDAGSESPSPQYLQKNIESLLKIGGIYDLIAADVEYRHRDLLRQWRLDTGAKTMVELLAERAQ